MKVNLSKRILSLLLALMMVLGMFPASPIHVYATEAEDDIRVEEPVPTTEAPVEEETTPPTTEAPVEEETTPPTTEAPAEEEMTPIKVETAVAQDTAALAEATYEVYVGGVGMADGDYLANNAASTTTDKPSGGYAYYENGTLTLHNYSYHGNGYNDDGFYAIIYSEGKLIVKLEGTNSLTNEVLDDSVAMGFDVSNAYFSGTGSLDISGVSYGIYAKTDLTIASGSINVDANNYGLFASKNIYITGGTTTVTSDDYGLDSENIEICGGVVSVTAYNIGIRAYYVDISGGTVTVTANNYYGVCADYSVEISGGSLTAKSNGYAVDTDSFYCTNEEMKAFLGYYFDGSNAEEYDAYYLDEEDIGSYNYVFIASNDSDSESTYSIYVGGIGMNNGEYLEEGAETATTEKPIDNYAYYRDGVLSLYNFEYLGAGYNYADGSYYQIYAPFNLTIELTGKNTLSVPEELTFSYCTGICAKSVVVEENANGSLTISGTTGGVFADNGDIEINGGTIDIDVDGTGIYALNNISVNGGNLKINADDGGMNCYNNEINITNGTVNITSGGNGIASVYGSVSIEGSNVIIASGRYAIYASTLFSMSNGSLDARCVNPLTEDNDSIYYAICSSNVPEFANNMRVRASADPDDSLGVYDASKRSNYDRIVAKEACAVHDYDDGVVTAPTCEDKGYTTYSCDTCGDFYIVNEVTALGHDYDEGTVTIKPGCETEGVMTYTCKNGCGIPKTEAIEATGHAYDYSNGIVTTEPGCETEGVKTYTCKNGCGIPKTEAIEALGHSYDNGVITTPANCENTGIRIYTCTRCPDSYTEVVAAFGHKYDDGVITLHPTLTEKGEKLFTCQRDFCDHSYTQEIPAWEQPVFYKISPEVTQQEFDSRTANMGTTKNTYKFEAKYYLYEELVNAGYTARVKTSVYLDGGTTPHATSYDGYTPDAPGEYKIVHELLVTEPGKAEIVSDTFTHNVTIGYAPDFDTMLPKVTQQQLKNGKADLGTLYEAPTFKLTPTVANWMGENFTVDSHMRVERDQGLGWRDVLSSTTNFTYTPDLYGDYRITYTQKLMGHGTAWETHTFVYTFTYAREPLTFKDLTPAATTAELEAGKKDLGVVNDTVVFSYKVPELTQEEVKLGYKIRTSLEVFDEEGNQVTGLAGTVTDGVYTYKHSMMGKHTVKLLLSIYHQPEYQGGATTVEAIEMEFTVDLQINYELKFLTQTPAVTAAEAAAGKTDLGTIERGQVFTCTYTPLPQWMADAGYKVENFTYDYVNGTQVGFGSNYPCTGGGNHELKMTLVLKDPLGNELQKVEHTYTCYVEPAPVESLEITSGDTIYMDLGSNAQKQLQAQILPLDAVQIINWSSSDESIVTVDDGGMLQAVSYGRATITATNDDGTVSDTCMVFVQGAPFMVDGVYLQPGQYLVQGSRKPTTAKPADNYVYYGPNADGDPQLTLHNYTFDTVGYYNGSNRYAVYAEDFLVIKLEGTSNVSLASAYNRNAFYLHGGAEILGDSDAVLNISNVERGFDVVGGISFEGGTIKINSNLIGIYTNGNVTIAGSDLDITAASAISTEHLKTGNLIVNSGSLTAVSTQQQALNLNGTISFFEGAYAIGSANADGSNPETFDAAKVDTYKYVYIGEPTAPTGLKGDVDLNGEVNMNDFVALARHIGEVEFITDPVAVANADVTGDSDVNMEDFVKVAQYIGEVIDQL